MERGGCGRGTEPSGQGVHLQWPGAGDAALTGTTYLPRPARWSAGASFAHGSRNDHASRPAGVARRPAVLVGRARRGIRLSGNDGARGARAGTDEADGALAQHPRGIHRDVAVLPCRVFLMVALLAVRRHVGSVRIPGRDFHLAAVCLPAIARTRAALCGVFVDSTPGQTRRAGAETDS